MTKSHSTQKNAGRAKFVEAREAGGFATPTAFAKSIRVIPATVLGWEAGTQTPQEANLEKIAAALGEEKSVVYGWFGVTTPPQNVTGNVAYIHGPNTAQEPTVDVEQRARLVGVMLHALEVGHITEQRWIEVAAVVAQYVGEDWPGPPGQ